MQNSSKNNFLTCRKYRYAYNGMEKDDEVSGNGNSYTTQFRQYDPRLGRWKSLDPLAGKFHYQSPYVAMDNNPILYTDTKGDSAGAKTLKDAQLYADDLNAMFFDKYKEVGAFQVVYVKYTVSDYSPFSPGYEQISGPGYMWAIVPNMHATKTDGSKFSWNTSRWTRRIFDVLMSNGMIEIKLNSDKISGSSGLSPQGGLANNYGGGEVIIYENDNEKWVIGGDNSSTWTYAGTLMHELIFHKHPGSKEESAREMQNASEDGLDLPSRIDESSHPGGNSVERPLNHNELRRLNRLRNGESARGGGKFAMAFKRLSAKVGAYMRRIATNKVKF